jgi:hypothetical protein
MYLSFVRIKSYFQVLMMALGVPGLSRFAEKTLSANGFSFHAPAFRGALFINPDTSQAVPLDHRICDARYPFAYTLSTREQNALLRPPAFLLQPVPSPA